MPRRPTTRSRRSRCGPTREERRGLYYDEANRPLSAVPSGSKALMSVIDNKLGRFLSSIFRARQLPDPALLSPIGKKVRRFLSNSPKRQDQYYLDLGGTFLEVWFRGWSESYNTPQKTIELELPPYIAGQTIVRLRAYDFPENGTVVSFANGAALQVYFYPFSDHDGHVYTVFSFYDPPRVVSQLEPSLAELEDPIIREAPCAEPCSSILITIGDKP